MVGNTMATQGIGTNHATSSPHGHSVSAYLRKKFCEGGKTKLRGPSFELEKRSERSQSHSQTVMKHTSFYSPCCHASSSYLMTCISSNFQSETIHHFLLLFFFDNFCCAL